MSSMQPNALTRTRTRRLKAALGRAGRWMLVAVVLCLAARAEGGRSDVGRIVVHVTHAR